MGPLTGDSGVISLPYSTFPYHCRFQQEALFQYLERVQMERDDVYDRFSKSVYEVPPPRDACGQFSIARVDFGVGRIGEIKQRTFYGPRRSHPPFPRAR